jgi:hypothetical protein
VRRCSRAPFVPLAAAGQVADWQLDVRMPVNLTSAIAASLGAGAETRPATEDAIDPVGVGVVRGLR